MELLICIKMDLALITYNGFICYKTKPNQTKSNQAIETNTAGSARGVSGEFGISSSIVIYYFLNLAKSRRSGRIVLHIAKTLEKHLIYPCDCL